MSFLIYPTIKESPIVGLTGLGGGATGLAYAGGLDLSYKWDGEQHYPANAYVEYNGPYTYSGSQTSPNPSTSPNGGNRNSYSIYFQIFIDPTAPTNVNRAIWQPNKWGGDNEMAIYMPSGGTKLSTRSGSDNGHTPATTDDLDPGWHSIFYDFHGPNEEHQFKAWDGSGFNTALTSVIDPLATRCDFDKFNLGMGRQSGQTWVEPFTGEIRMFAAFSDRRLKENIVQTGISDSGLSIYEYNYTYQPNKRYQGVMAQDLLNTKYSNSVSKSSNGFYKVNYKELDVVFKEV